MEKVECLDWVVLIVLVMKVDGFVCICGDFKVIVNLYLDILEYLFFISDELFIKFNGG